MPAPIKAFKRYDAAKVAAAGRPVLRIGGLYLVIEGDQMGISLTEICVISADDSITGTITAGHLDRLGNANWARAGEQRQPHQVSKKTAFPERGRIPEPRKTLINAS